MTSIFKQEQWTNMLTSSGSELKICLAPINGDAIKVTKSFNSLWPSDDIWPWRSWSTSIEVLAWSTYHYSDHQKHISMRFETISNIFILENAFENVVWHFIQASMDKLTASSRTIPWTPVMCFMLFTTRSTAVKQGNLMKNIVLG